VSDLSDLVYRGVGTLIAALAAAFSIQEELVDTGHAYQDVHDGFDHHPLTKQQVYNVPIGTAADKPSKPDKAPVEGTDDDQCAGDPAQGAHVFTVQLHKIEEGRKDS
jgi:hypothetical protein